MSAARLLPRVLPADVITEEMALPGAPDELLPEEAQRSGSFAPKRLAEYRASRHCARRALARLGIGDFPVVSDSSRVPIWPPEITGSITHTGDLAGGWCGVAIARKAAIRSIGIDAELARPLEPKLWSSVLTATEHAELERRPEAERGLAAVLAFSAKEALYKCQYPLTRQFLGFHDVEIVLEPLQQTFLARLLREAGSLFRAGDTLRGRFVQAGGIVLTALVLPHEGARRVA